MFDASPTPFFFDDEPDKVVYDPAPLLEPSRPPATWPDATREERLMQVCLLTPDGAETWHRLGALKAAGITACGCRYATVAGAHPIDGTTSGPVEMRVRYEQYGDRMCQLCFTAYELARGRVADAHVDGEAHPEETMTEEMARIRRATAEMPPLTVMPRKDPTR